MTTANIGTSDRVVRAVVGVGLVALAYFTDVIPSGTPNVIAMIVGGVLVATALVSLCPLYRIFGCSTVAKD
ncbi:MAG: YgaP family membrane protein [Hyphomicrobiaceae bacterium]